MKKIINDEQLALHDFNMINHGLTDKATKIFHSNNFKSKQISIFDIFYFFLILTPFYYYMYNFHNYYFNEFCINLI